MSFYRVPKRAIIDVYQAVTDERLTVSKTAAITNVDGGCPLVLIAIGGAHMAIDLTEQEKNLRLAYRARQRLTVATAFELLVVSSICLTVLWFELSVISRVGAPLALVASSQPALIAGGAMFMEVFFTLLTGRSLLVSAVTQKSWGPLSFLGLEPFLDTILAAQRHRSTENSESTSGSIEDPIEEAFRSNLIRSGNMLRAAQRRPNALLFVGTSVAAIGLGFFIATLPGVLYPNNSPPILSAQDIGNRVLELTPRLLMLVFIQVLAGFFLRQYRSSMEELRYYETVLRSREDHLLGYLAIRDKGKSAVLAFAERISQHKDLVKIQQGETSMIIEAQKAEQNEFKGVVESFLDLLKSNNSSTPPTSPKT